MTNRLIPRALAALFAAGVFLTSTGCATHHQPVGNPHAHLHEYRHGYYNPVDGYFHDDHWRYTPRAKAYHSAYPAKNAGVTYWHDRTPHHHRTIPHHDH